METAHLLDIHRRGIELELLVTTEIPQVQSYQRYAAAGADFIRRHPLWRRATKTPFAAKVTKYTLGSVLAFGMSTVSFFILDVIGVGTTWASIISFLIGAVPNWILNRRWAWGETGRAPAKQTITYIAVSALVIIITSLVTGWTDSAAKSIGSNELRGLVVTGAYVAVTVLFFAVKFVIYELFVFGERSRVSAA